MPEVISYLNGVEIRKYVSVRMLICKTIAVSALVAAGFFSGYDGPVAHIGMIIAIIVVRSMQRFPTIWHILNGDYFLLSSGGLASTDDLENVQRVKQKRNTQIFAAAGNFQVLSFS